MSERGIATLAIVAVDLLVVVAVGVRSELHTS